MTYKCVPLLLVLNILFLRNVFWCFILMFYKAITINHVEFPNRLQLEAQMTRGQCSDHCNKHKTIATPA